jgi:hypothetical protein
MTITKVAYLQVPSFERLERHLQKKEIDYSIHNDGADEKEVWIEIINENLKDIQGEYLNDKEYQECVEEDVEYIIFYE